MEDPPSSRPGRRWKRPLGSTLAPALLASFVLPVGAAFAQPGSEGAIASGIGAGQIALLVVLLLLSGLMSGSETALTALGSWRIRQLREEGGATSREFELLERQPTRFITTLLIGNNLVNIAATALVTQMSITLSRGLGFSESLAVGYATGVMTFLVLVFGEITPKSIAVHHAVGFSRAVIRPVWLLSVVLYPVGLFFAWVTNLVLRALRLEPTTNALITENELRLMLRSAEESGVIEAQEQEMIKGVIDLEETVVREVMTPRVDVVAVHEDADLRELLALATDHGYSRFPVFGETIDDVRGIVYARDLLPYLGHAEPLANVRVRDLMSAPQFVPETLSVLNLLRDMRARKLHLAVAVDEFGGTSGLITLEDIIEEITGEIYDETDPEEEEDVVVLADGCLRIQGAAHIEEVADALGLVFDDDDEYDTLAGFLISRFRHIPSRGEVLEYGGVRFEVEEADERRVTAVRATLLGGEEGERPDEDAAVEAATGDPGRQTDGS